MTTPLHRGVEHGTVNTVRRLLNEGASVNSRTLSGATPLVIAASRGNVPIIQLLLNRGANAKLKGMFNSTPLMRAVHEGHVSAVRVLIPHSNLNAKNSNGKTALNIAIDNNNPRIGSLLMKAIYEKRRSKMNIFN